MALQRDDDNSAQRDNEGEPGRRGREGARKWVANGLIYNSFESSGGEREGGRGWTRARGDPRGCGVSNARKARRPLEIIIFPETRLRNACYHGN